MTTMISKSLIGRHNSQVSMLALLVKVEKNGCLRAPYVTKGRALLLPDQGWSVGWLVTLINSLTKGTPARKSPSYPGKNQSRSHEQMLGIKDG